MAEGLRSEGALAEFTALRAEILQLTQQQHQLLALHLTFTGAVLGFAVTRPGLADLALIVPAMSYLFCIRSLNFSTEIQQIASYIREDLSGKVPGGLGWEAWFVKNGGRNVWLGKIADSISFPVASVLGLSWAYSSAFPPASPTQPWQFGLMAFWILGAVGVVHQSYELWIGDRRRVRWFRDESKRKVEADTDQAATPMPDGPPNQRGEVDLTT